MATRARLFSWQAARVCGFCEAAEVNTGNLETREVYLVVIVPLNQPIRF